MWHVIRDNTDYLPYKASFIPDKLDYQMLDEIQKRIESYKEKLNLGEKVYDDYLFDLISTVDLKFRMATNCKWEFHIVFI